MQINQIILTGTIDDLWTTYMEEENTESAYFRLTFHASLELKLTIGVVAYGDIARKVELNYQEDIPVFVMGSLAQLELEEELKGQGCKYYVVAGTIDFLK